MTAFATFVTGRYTRWFVIFAWVIVAAMAGSLQPKLQEKTSNETISYLPGESDAATVAKLQKSAFKSGAETPAVIVFSARNGGSVAEHQANITKVLDALGGGSIDKTGDLVSPYSPLGQQMGMASTDGKAVFAVLPFETTDGNELVPIVADVRKLIDEQADDDLSVYVTGEAGVVADSVEVFNSMDRPLLLATVVLVLVLLLVSYRSPIIPFVPLLTVAMSYMVAAGIVYLLVDAGTIIVNGQTTIILIVLMFGAGTDYCLLLTSRAREELKKTPDRYQAVRSALTATAPAIFSSAATVICAMLVLLVADLDSTRTMGPVLALGIGATLFAGLSLLPALLSVGGRWAFWPRIPRAGDAADEGKSGAWRRVGHFVQCGPARALVLGLVILGLFAVGNIANPASLGHGDTDAFTKKTDSARGFDVLTDRFEAGRLAPSVVIVRADEAADAAKAATDVIDALRQRDEVEFVGEPQPGKDGDVISMTLTLKADPFSATAERQLPKLRAVARDAASDADGEALIGGMTGQLVDTKDAQQRDQGRIIPLILLVIFVILAVLLRALIAPIHLILSVIVSFFATLGFTLFLFDRVLAHPGVDGGYATYLFLFVVALGVDYNIFLVSRIREEAAKLGTANGTIEALARTGGVITRAGAVLAGTFLVMAGMPFYTMVQVGVGVALGILLDTFIVRSFLVPAMMTLLGERNWWPRHVHAPMPSWSAAR